MSLFEKLTHQMTEAVESGLSLALHSKNQEIEPLHVVWGLVTNTDSVLNQALNRASADKAALELELKSAVEKFPKVSTVSKENIKVSRNLYRTLEAAEGLSVKNGDSFIAVDSWIIANLNEPFFKESIGKYVDLMELKKNLEASRAGRKIDSQSADEKLESLSKYGIDLTQRAAEGKLDPVIGRDEEVSRTMQILI